VFPGGYITVPCVLFHSYRADNIHVYFYEGVELKLHETYAQFPIFLKEKI